MTTLKQHDVPSNDDFIVARYKPNTRPRGTVHLERADNAVFVFVNGQREVWRKTEGDPLLNERYDFYLQKGLNSILFGLLDWGGRGHGKATISVGGEKHEIFYLQPNTPGGVNMPYYKHVAVYVH